MEGPKFFFSYAREDSVFVMKIARELRKAGAILWLDRLDIRGGQRWDEAVQAALKSCEGMLAVLSPRSVASFNFMDEVSYALEEKKQLIPVLYEECTVPFRLRRVQYVDFRSGYEDGFAELLMALGLDQLAASVTSLIEEREPEEATLPVTRREEERRAGVVVAEEYNSASEPIMPSAKSHRQTFRQRRKGALIGAAIGSIVAVSAPILGVGWSFFLFFCFLVFSFSGAIAGAIAGSNRKVIKITAVTCLVGMVVAGAECAASHVDFKWTVVLLESIFWGSTISPIFGATAGVIFDRFKRRSMS